MTLTPHVMRIHPSGPLYGIVSPPTSKYHTLRYILSSTLASDYSIINNPAQSDDTSVLLRICEKLGAWFRIDHMPAESMSQNSFIIKGNGGTLKRPPDGILDVGNAGAVLRLLLGICTLSSEPITLTTSYTESLGRRPNADLLRALMELGAKVDCRSPQGTLPISVERGKLRGGKIQISGKKSSQYISSLLFLAPLLAENTEIEVVDGLTSAGYLDLTIRILGEVGIQVINPELHRYYIVPGKQQYQSGKYTVPGDYPSAAALLAAVAVAKGAITITNLSPDDVQGEILLEIFSRMGMQIYRNGYTITAKANEPLCGISFNGDLVIDSVPVIAAAACYASSHSRIYNVASLRYKESDRINDLATELNKLGCHVVPSVDALDIYPLSSNNAHGGVRLDAHSDHRMVQALAVAGLGSKEPIMIEHAEHISKSYPSFFSDLGSLGTKVELV